MRLAGSVAVAVAVAVSLGGARSAAAQQQPAAQGELVLGPDWIFSIALGAATVLDSGSYEDTFGQVLVGYGELTVDRPAWYRKTPTWSKLRLVALHGGDGTALEAMGAIGRLYSTGPQCRKTVVGGFTKDGGYSVGAAEGCSEWGGFAWLVGGRAMAFITEEGDPHGVVAPQIGILLAAKRRQTFEAGQLELYVAWDLLGAGFGAFLDAKWRLGPIYLGALFEGYPSYGGQVAVTLGFWR